MSTIKRISDLLTAGNITAARQLAERSYRQHPSVELLQVLARIAHHEKRFADAISCLQVVVHKQPTNRDAWTLLGTNQMMLGDLIGAVHSFAKYSKRI